MPDQPTSEETSDVTVPIALAVARGEWADVPHVVIEDYADELRDAALDVLADEIDRLRAVIFEYVAARRAADHPGSRPISETARIIDAYSALCREVRS